jgi:ribosomal protein S18 acetylase RimI-like enzyme
LEEIVFRSAAAADSEQVAEIYLASREAFLGFAPLVHSEDDVRRWIASQLLPTGGVTVAAAAEPGAPLVGMMAVSREGHLGWIDQLYLRPDCVGRGLGARFVRLAKQKLGAPIRLYTFQENAGARRFYERHGFRILELGDGSGNEERCPDILYEWT